MTLACGGGDPPPSDAAIDLRRGSIDGVALGTPTAQVERRFGAGERLAWGEPFAPKDLTWDEVGLPGALGPPERGSVSGDREMRRYDDRLIDAWTRSGMFYVAVFGKGARTREGVAVGDDLDDVRRVYPASRCGVRDAGPEHGEKFPYCTFRARAGHYVWFGQDPVGTIALSSAPLG